MTTCQVSTFGLTGAPTMVAGRQVYRVPSCDFIYMALKCKVPACPSYSSSVTSYHFAAGFFTAKKHYIIITVYKLYIINWSHLHFVVVLDGLIGGLSVSPNRASRKVREQDRLSIPMPRAKVARAFGKTTRPTGCGSQGLDAR